MKILLSIIVSSILLMSVNANAGIMQSSNNDLSKTHLTSSQALQLTKDKLWDLEKSPNKRSDVNPIEFYENTNLIAYLDLFNSKNSHLESNY